MSTNTPSEERPDGPSSVSEEQWAEFARQAENTPADAPKEPSARARMVTARLRALDDEATRAQGGRRRWGRKSKPAEPWQPDGWRTGPAWQQMNGRSARRRRIAGALGLIAVVGLLIIAMRPSLLTDHLPGGENRASADATPLLTESAPPTAAPPAEIDPARPTRAEPFRGSPALGWADGADGIELPEARAVGGVSKERVGYALRTTKELLVSANLAPSTLRGERPGKALNLLDPLQKDGRGLMDRALAEPTEKQDPLLLFSRFDPAEARLVGDVVKTRGRMTFEAGRDGSVEVHADYSFVYPLMKPGADADEVARTIVRRQLTTVLPDPARTVATPGKIALLVIKQHAGNSTCDVYDGFLHPSFPSDMPEGEPTGPAVDPYDRSEWPDEECGTVTRT